MICDPLASPTDPLCNVKLTENLDSRVHRSDQQGESWELHFTVQGTNDQCLIGRRLFENQSIGLPAFFGNIPFNNHILRNIGWETWDVLATYTWAGSRQTALGVPKAQNQSYSTRGGRIHLTRSLSHVRREPPTAPDLDGAINWDGERVKGVDVIAPNIVYSESFMLDRSFIFDGGKASKFNTWSQFTGSVHGDPPGTAGPGLPEFRYWENGEVLLNGVTMRQTSAHLFEVTFEFHISTTKRNFEIPQSISPVDPPDTIDIEGWDLVWFQYSKQDDDTGNGKVVKTLPKALYVEQIYPRVDFTELGIGLSVPGTGILAPECTNPDFKSEWETYCVPPP